MDKNKMLEEVRKRMAEKKGSRTRDPMQFIPPQVKPNEELKYKFYVLPGMEQGDTCVGGSASKSMDLWYITAGTHWINQRLYECPRVHDNEHCAFCQLGFDLLKDAEDENVRKNIIKTYLARSAYVVNIYFPPFDSNPPDLRGKVMWYAMPKSVFDIMESTIMRDSAGDVIDPQAYGLFYDPVDAYVFQLEVHRQGNFNEYKQSRFLPNTKGPIVRNKDGSANVDEIRRILNMRHDLYTKFAPRDANTLMKLAKQVMNPEPDNKATHVDEHVDDTTDNSAKNVVTNTQNTTSVTDVVDETPSMKNKQPAKTTSDVRATVTENPDDDELNRLLNEIRQGK